MKETVNEMGKENINTQRFTIKHIFSDNHNWEVFFLKHRNKLREVEIKEVQKMLSCSTNYFLYQCQICGEYRTIHLGCNSRLCTHCGKKYTDKWANQVACNTLNVVHRHVVFTIPEQLRFLFHEYPELFKVLMDCVIDAISDMMNDKRKIGDKITPGVIAVLHTYGKDMKFNPHVHTLVTEGGFTKSGKWVQFGFFPFEVIRETWQYWLLTNFKETIPKTIENNGLIDYLFKTYSNGFYVRAPLESRVKNKKQMAKYIGRYIRHPAVAESRIEDYDGKEVKFYYEDHEKQIHHVTMNTDEFISALIGHVPNEQFKTVRYYGAYYRVKKKVFKQLLGMISIIQKKLTGYVTEWAPECEKCGVKMKLVHTWLNKPPIMEEFGKKIVDWLHFSSV